MVSTPVASTASVAFDVVDRQGNFVLCVQEQNVADVPKGNILHGMGDTNQLRLWQHGRSQKGFGPELPGERCFLKCVSGLR